MWWFSHVGGHTWFCMQSIKCSYEMCGIAWMYQIIAMSDGEQNGSCVMLYTDMQIHVVWMFLWILPHSFTVDLPIQKWDMRRWSRSSQHKQSRANISVWMFIIQKKCHREWLSRAMRSARIYTWTCMDVHKKEPCPPGGPQTSLFKMRLRPSFSASQICPGPT